MRESECSSARGNEAVDISERIPETLARASPEREPFVGGNTTLGIALAPTAAQNPRLRDFLRPGLCWAAVLGAGLSSKGQWAHSSRPMGKDPPFGGGRNRLVEPNGVNNQIHPSEEHELVAASVTHIVRDKDDRAVGLHPIVLPGSLQERDVLAQIDRRRWVDD
jgi:hypothetical protein